MRPKKIGTTLDVLLGGAASAPADSARPNTAPTASPSQEKEQPLSVSKKEERPKALPKAERLFEAGSPDQPVISFPEPKKQPPGVFPLPMAAQGNTGSAGSTSAMLPSSFAAPFPAVHQQAKTAPDLEAVSSASPEPRVTRAEPPAKPRVRSWKKVTSLVVTFAILGIGVWAVANIPALYSQLTFSGRGALDESPNEHAAPQRAATESAETTAEPDQISIPAIGVKAPLVFSAASDEKGVLKDLESGVVHYANTALPGQDGNAVIFGHSSNFLWARGSYNYVFALLNRLSVGDRFTLFYAGKKYEYEVVDREVVAPSETRVLADRGLPTVTLITCDPPGTTWKRLVVVGRQVRPTPAVQEVPKRPHLPSV